MIRVVIADDHELIREGVKKIVRHCADLKIVGEAADLKQSIALIAQVRPDVAVLDISLPDSDGLDGLAELRRHFPALRIVMLSMHPEERFALAAMRAGALAYVSKSMASSELVEAIRCVGTGRPWVGPRVAALLQQEGDPAARARHESLTPRESEIVALIGAGLQIKQVAAELGISVSSVNTYRSRIFRKMGMSTNASLIRYALQHGLAG
ncbi:response regulator transcription factor [Massilia sp. YIM B02763]|uniref:response regulator n=1 Tax=Massilia sp. YIM B02763 TaxID=3050130 RepID=UPI0025B6B1CB|nr:response regulator transcription factor [Massilia sp. YIM B02763]MDN4053944.1 response regulator transcription factor [Massilia sp. YIM B02763]